MYISILRLGQKTILNAQCRNKYWWSGGCNGALVSYNPYWCSGLSSASAQYSLHASGLCCFHKCVVIPACTYSDAQALIPAYATYVKSHYIGAGAVTDCTQLKLSPHNTKKMFPSFLKITVFLIFIM